jgi:AcrR family transcriptional regulator
MMARGRAPEGGGATALGAGEFGAGGPASNARRGNLGPREVVAAALGLTREVGLAGLTMRGLARQLGVSPMAAYYWVPSKQALVDLVLEAVLDEIATREVTTGTWRERLAANAIVARAVIVSYPGVSAALLGAPAGPRARAMITDALGLLREAGYDGERLAWAWGTYHAFMVGQFLLVAHAPSWPAASGRPPRANDDLGPTFAAARGEEAFSWGLNRLLDGLEAAAAGQPAG